MSEIVEMFDSRGWNGYLPLAYRYFKGVGIKISDGKKWNPIDLWMLQRQWAWAKEKYNLLRLPFHFWRGHYSWENSIEHGKAQAYFFHNSILKKFGGDFGELPPAIDLEVSLVGKTKGPAVVKSVRACLEKTADLWNVAPLIYSAGWWWDKQIFSYLDGWEPWKEYDLWEADPPPDTSIKGWPDGGVITQLVLDQETPGFNAVIDINETTQAWIDSIIIPPAPPIPPVPPLPDCGKERIAMQSAIGTLEEGLKL